MNREYLQLIYTNNEDTGWGVRKHESVSSAIDNFERMTEDLGRMMEPEENCELIQVIQCPDKRRNSFLNASVQRWIPHDSRPNKLVRVLATKEVGREPKWVFAPKWNYLEQTPENDGQIEERLIIQEKESSLAEDEEHIAFREDDAAFLYWIFQAIYGAGGSLVFVNENISAQESLEYTSYLFPIVYQRMPRWMRGSFSSTSYIDQKRQNTIFAFANRHFANEYPMNGTVSRDQIPTELERAVFERIAPLAANGELDDNLFLHRVLKSCDLPEQLKTKLPETLPDNLMEDLPEDVLQSLLDFVLRPGQTSYDRIIWVYALLYLDTEDLRKKFPDKMEVEMNRNPEFYTKQRLEEEKAEIMNAVSWVALFGFWKKYRELKQKDAERYRELQNAVEQRFFELADLIPMSELPIALKEFWELVRFIKNRHEEEDVGEQTEVLPEFCRQVYAGMERNSLLARVWYYLSYLAVFDKAIPDRRKLLQNNRYGEFPLLFQASERMGLDFLDSNIQLEVYDEECGYKLNAFYVYILIRKNMDIIDYPERLYKADHIRTKEFFSFLLKHLERETGTETSSYQRIHQLYEEITRPPRPERERTPEMVLISNEDQESDRKDIHKETQKETQKEIPKEIQGADQKDDRKMNQEERPEESQKEDWKENQKEDQKEDQRESQKEDQKENQKENQKEESESQKEEPKKRGRILKLAGESVGLAVLFLLLAFAGRRGLESCITAAVVLISLGTGLLISGKLKEKKIDAADLTAVLMIGGSLFLLVMYLVSVLIYR